MRSCGLQTRSVGPTNRLAGLLLGRTHLSGTTVSLVGADPGVPISHTPLFVRVSLGRVQGQVEIFRKVRHAPLATTATKTSSVIYLENRS
jgi:hypothetical protein